MIITRFLVQNVSALFFFAEWQPSTSRNLSHTDQSVHVFPGKRQQVNNWSHGLCDWSLWVFLMQREAISYLMTAITFKQSKTKTHQTHFLLLLYFPGQSEYSKEGTFAISRLLCFISQTFSDRACTDYSSAVWQSMQYILWKGGGGNIRAVAGSHGYIRTSKHF